MTQSAAHRRPTNTTHAVGVDDAANSPHALSQPDRAPRRQFPGAARGGTEPPASLPLADTLSVDLPAGYGRLTYDPATGVAVLTDPVRCTAEYLMMPIGLLGQHLCKAIDPQVTGPDAPCGYDPGDLRQRIFRSPPSGAKPPPALSSDRPI